VTLPLTSHKQPATNHGVRLQPVAHSSGGEVLPSYLLALPPELRNQVYETAIAECSKLDQLHLINACRQTRSEGLALFYSSNRFDFPYSDHGTLDRKAFHDWLEFIGVGNAEELQHLRFTFVLGRDRRHLDVYFDRKSQTIRAHYTPTAKRLEQYVRLMLPRIEKGRQGQSVIDMWKQLSANAMPLSFGRE